MSDRTSWRKCRALVGCITPVSTLSSRLPLRRLRQRLTYGPLLRVVRTFWIKNVSRTPLNVVFPRLNDNRGALVGFLITMSCRFARVCSACCSFEERLKWGLRMGIAAREPRTRLRYVSSIAFSDVVGFHVDGGAYRWRSLFLSFDNSKYRIIIDRQKRSNSMRRRFLLLNGSVGTNVSQQSKSRHSVFVRVTSPVVTIVRFASASACRFPAKAIVCRKCVL